MTNNLSLSDFYYLLPEEKIARYPLEKRDEAALLVYRQGQIGKDVFKNLPAYLGPDDLLVFNNTRVIPARLWFRKESGATIEILCLEPYDPLNYEESFASRHKVIWKCLAGNAKKWKHGTLKIQSIQNKNLSLSAEILDKQNNEYIVVFRWDEDLSFAEILEMAGHVPIPPYLSREDEEIDRIRYQTLYARIRGAVAAPTAGLHFTESVIRSLQEKGCGIEELTLHVGAGTFIPVKSSNIYDHNMHEEYFSVPAQTIQTLIRHSSHITAVGTTSLRALESLYWLGVKCLKGLDYHSLDQWEAYSLPQEIPPSEALSALLAHSSHHIQATTRLMIVPGYTFKLTRKLITNFHQPESTLLMLVAAFVGKQAWKNIYAYALQNNFRFLSYGDSSLLIPFPDS